MAFIKQISVCGFFVLQATSRMSVQEEDDLPANHTGPKGVINDWRRFKLDSVDQSPQNKRQLLRQMSSPRDDDKERLNRKVGGNISAHIIQISLD